MELKLNQAGNIKVIEIYGKFDIESTEEFEKVFSKLLEAKPPIISVNMAKLDYIDSSGIGCLIKCLNNFKSQKGRMLLVGMKPMIQNVFKLAKLDLFFEVLTQDQFEVKFLSEDDSDIDELLK